MSVRRKRTETYHHGDLARALVAAALVAVQRHGHDAVGLRDLGRKTGVTVGAIYRHFPDRDALLAAVARDGFLSLAGKTAEATAGKHGRARLMGVGRAYVAFASSEPSLFRLMFSRIGMSVARDPALTQIGAFEQLRDALADASGCAADAVPEDLLAMAWSVAHGAASLIADGVWKPDDRRATAAIKRLIDQIL